MWFSTSITLTLIQRVDLVMDLYILNIYFLILCLYPWLLLVPWIRKKKVWINLHRPLDLKSSHNPNSSLNYFPRPLSLSSNTTAVGSPHTRPLFSLTLPIQPPIRPLSGIFCSIHDQKWNRRTLITLRSYKSDPKSSSEIRFLKIPSADLFSGVKSSSPNLASSISFDLKPLNKKARPDKRLSENPQFRNPNSGDLVLNRG